MTTKSESPLLYNELEEWKDITPVPQEDEGPAPLAPILYGEEYKDATDYFRAIVKKGERSKRVLDLTEHIIRLNPSHYTVWQYRYDTLLAIDADLEAELHLMDDIATKFLKTYQVWHHRRLLLSRVRQPARELEFIAQGIKDVDTKNYHTWAYRQWILSEFNEDELWAGELPFVEELLETDVRNNSAWHHRFFVVWDSGLHGDESDREAVLKRELDFTKDKIATAPNNPSAWNYLRGVLETSSAPFSTLKTFVLPYTKPRTLSDPSDPAVPVDLDNPLPSSSAQLPVPYAIEFLADVLEEEAASIQESQGDDPAKAAQALYSTLATEVDPIRQRYWEFRSREATRKQTLVSSAG